MAVRSQFPALSQLWDGAAASVFLTTTPKGMNCSTVNDLAERGEVQHRTALHGSAQPGIARHSKEN
jgi:hypothetical protein